jgi:hypothetical protein
MTMYRMTRPGDPIGTISLPVRDHISAATATSLLMTDLSREWIPEGKTVERHIIQGGILTLQRNEAVQRMEGDWLLFIDDDMVWQPDAVRRLVEVRNELDLDMVGALCFRRSAPYQPTLYMREQPTSGSYNYLETWDSDVVEVDATGMAFVLIHKRVFEKIAGSKMPSAAARRQMGPSQFFKWEGVLGEDLRFCQDAKAAGCRIYVDTRIKIGHMAEVEIGGRQFLMEVALRSDEEHSARAHANLKMGLETLTRNEAREKLGL